MAGASVYEVTATVRTRRRRLVVPVEELRDVHWQDVVSLRRPQPYIGQRHFSGWYWSTRTAQHVWFESFKERDFLLHADFDPSIEMIISQPFHLRWPDEESPMGGHIPDYLVVHREGLIEAVSVKPAERAGSARAQHDRSTSVLAAAGLKAVLWTGTCTARSRNLEFLVQFLQPWSALDQLVARHAGAFREPFSLRWLYQQNSRELVVACWHGVATGALSCDLDMPFTGNTIVNLTVPL
jgi:hypothetical protein